MQVHTHILSYKLIHRSTHENTSMDVCMYEDKMTLVYKNKYQIADDVYQLCI